MKNDIYFNFKGNKKEQSDFTSNLNSLINFPTDNKILFKLIKMTPTDLLEVLHIELQLGNEITSISNTDWPHENSIVIILKSRFHIVKASLPLTVKFLEVNDIHYWREQLVQRFNGSDHLIIT